MKYTSFIVIVVLCLIAAVGCTKSQIKNNCENNTITISPTNHNKDSAIIHIPTAFTPNGDNLNDLFRPFTAGIEISSFEVSKGNNILYTEAMIGSNWSGRVGWDGTDEDDELCKDGVYTYEIKGRNDTDGKFDISGEVSLITKEDNMVCECRYEDMIHPIYGFTSSSAEACNDD